MRPGGGKDKGGAFEREICCSLSLWLSKGERKDILVRSEGSGARYTNSTKKGTSVGYAGDLMASHPIAFRFCNLYVVECKHWKKLDMTQFLHGKGDLYEALKKVRQEARDNVKTWMLVAKQNHYKTLIFIENLDFIGTLKTKVKHHLLFNSEIAVFVLEELMTNALPEDLIREGNLNG